MAMAWRRETEGPLCESVDGEDGELCGDIVHAVVGPLEIAVPSATESRHDYLRS